MTEGTRNRTARRLLVAGWLGAASVCAAAGPAAAAPVRADTLYTASTATALLGSTDPALTGVVRVTEVRGSTSSVDIELFRAGWSCTVSGVQAEADIVTLESATAVGTFTWGCVEDDIQGLAPTLSGTGVIDLAWTGVGDARKEPLDHCVGRFLVRPAAVDGQVAVHGDLDAVLTTAAFPEDSYLAYDHHVCPPGINKPAP